MKAYSTDYKGERGNPFRCDICGRFIGYDEFEKKEIETYYKPETLYESELISHTHKKCKTNEIKKRNHS
ncbi:MAG: hypothetical protein H5T96_09725 [Tissierellales bacterium]|nr:hypothetical protein [Tissierellales bacterium]